MKNEREQLKHFEEPAMELIALTEDVIVSSNGSVVDTGDTPEG